MSKLFTNCFLAEYSFSGKKGKKKFCDLFIFPIILSKYMENINQFISHLQADLFQSSKSIINKSIL